MPVVPTGCRARWWTRPLPRRLAGGRGRRCARAWPRPTGGTLTTSCPTDNGPSPEAAFATDQLIEDIGRRSRRGGAILLGAQAIRVLGQVATLVVLARLLPPFAFGLLAMVASLGAILDLVKEFGVSAATIQKQGISHAQVSALFWINAAVGALLGAVLVLAAPALARFYGQPELEAVAQWLALGFVPCGVTVQPWALLRRHLRLGPIGRFETAGGGARVAVARALSIDVAPDHADACAARHAGLRNGRCPGRLAGADPVRPGLGAGDAAGGAVQHIGGLSAGPVGRKLALHDPGTDA